ncbi:hypothetical protein [Sphingobium subterraneum]|uniref:Uncharacterized protein n=1 Tax=Sphingobium subterraneum TaxID=627688 RepID=A0A841J357_9SPHN|nr:hypothetical protein [Sphingobium subterraneum]MBB6125403.1 hypothetical protein [Sphingobium subterraneum]
MADTWIQGSFAFRCSAAEAALLVQAVDAAHDMCAALGNEPPGPDLLAVFPPTDPGDLWSGFRAAFADPEFPCVGADFSSAGLPDEPENCVICFSSMDDFDPGAIAMLIQRCCQQTLRIAPVGFEWAMTCSKPRIGEIGGGWCAVFADRIAFESTGEALSRALDGIL